MCVSGVRRWAVKNTMKVPDDVDVDEGDCVTDDGVLGHFVAIFTFSFLVGLVILHTSILWERIQHGEPYHMSDRNMERLMARYYGYEYYYYDYPRHFDLIVNTSYFIH